MPGLGSPAVFNPELTALSWEEFCADWSGNTASGEPGVTTSSSSPELPWSSSSHGAVWSNTESLWVEARPFLAPGEPTQGLCDTSSVSSSEREVHYCVRHQWIVRVKVTPRSLNIHISLFVKSIQIWRMMCKQMAMVDWPTPNLPAPYVQSCSLRFTASTQIEWSCPGRDQLSPYTTKVAELRSLLLCD